MLIPVTEFRTEALAIINLERVNKIVQTTERGTDGHHWQVLTFHFGVTQSIQVVWTREQFLAYVELRNSPIIEPSSGPVLNDDIPHC